MLLYLTLLQAELCSWVLFLCLSKILAGNELGSCSGLGSAVAHSWGLWEGWCWGVGSAEPGTQTLEMKQRAKSSIPMEAPGNRQAGAELTLLKTVSFHFLCVGAAWLICVPAFCLLVICWFGTTNFSVIVERSLCWSRSVSAQVWFLHPVVLWVLPLIIQGCSVQGATGEGAQAVHGTLFWWPIINSFVGWSISWDVFRLAGQTCGAHLYICERLK